MPNVGDFTVLGHALGLAREEHAERSARAQEADEEKRAPVTTDYPTWEDNPQRLDFPGIDTPSESPGVLPKDLMDPAPTQTTRKVRGETPVDPIGTEEREQQTERARLSQQDVSLAPEEAFEGKYTESQERGATRAASPKSFAGDIEADLAFDAAERDRLF